MQLSKSIGARGTPRARRPPTPARRAVWEEFLADVSLQRTYNIQPEEIESLGTAAMLGNFNSKTDLLFMLSVIRRPGRR